MPVCERKAQSLGDLFDVIEEIQQMHGGNGWYERLWYRGHANCSWGLQPSIQRCSASEVDERHLCNDFYIRARRITPGAPPRKDYAAWLALMQHYGIPTRLLDWSASPLVAAFFAVSEQHAELEAQDACVWVLRPGELNAREGDASLHPLDSKTALAMMQSAFVPHERKWITDRTILACYATSSDLRMYAQQACFTVHRSRVAQLDDPAHEDLVHRICIPASAKAHMRMQLGMVGINAGFIYPDLDHIAQSLRRGSGI